MKYLMLFGTRPEAIKLFPVWKAMKLHDMDVLAVSIGQHKSLLDTTCEDLGFKRDVVRNAFMHPIQPELLRISMEEITSCRPDMVVVQGDTFSTWAGAQAAFFQGIPIAHLEAGLRSHQLCAPFPEEGIRQEISRISDLHLCPSSAAVDNLKAEGVSGPTYLVGQTGLSFIPSHLKDTGRQCKILCTLHRRESTYEYQKQIIDGISQFLSNNPDYYCLFVRHPSTKYIPSGEGFVTISPLTPKAMLEDLASSSLCLTDSGGLQEEAEYLGVPCLIARTVRDRGFSDLASPDAKTLAGQITLGIVYSDTIRVDDFPHEDAPIKVLRALHDFHGTVLEPHHSRT